MDQEQEREIIKKVQSGERREFALLIEEYKKPVFNLAFRMTGSYEDADDLTQEAFIRAYQQLARFHLEKKFFTWLYTISLNLIRNHLKKKARDITLHVENGLTMAMSCPEKEVDRQMEETMRRLGNGLLMLPVDLREAIVMKYHSDLTFEEMSVVTGASVSALKMRVYRGLEKLKKWLEKEK